ncbi:UDP-N-acetylglucosamine 1-carboxyvinyltransferase [Candidatus Saccharibacteria bacterium]|nr:UDP-N-acetylglucosamine 1-carboxyvinyltransferase [Candidatus Saccharibacteria bacterium]
MSESKPSAKETRRQSYKSQVGRLVESLRLRHGWTQSELAKKLGTSQSAIARIENGDRNITLDTINHLGRVLHQPILTINDSEIASFLVNGGNELKGSIGVLASKNASLGVLCAALANRGTTTIKGISRVEECNRIIEVIESIGFEIEWKNHRKDLKLTPPREFNLDLMDIDTARRTRSALMMMSTFLHRFKSFKLPFAGGCSLGERTVEPHLQALSHFGLDVDTRCENGFYTATVADWQPQDQVIILTERGDTTTENAIIAAAQVPAKTIIKNASPNYMVQDVCFFLEKLGVKFEGIGTTTLTIYGKKKLKADIEYAPAEDPIEAMTFIAAGLVTNSSITIKRVPIEFMEIELQVLRTMGAEFDLSPEYLSTNGRSRLVDLYLRKSQLVAPIDKITPMPFPGLNIDNLPFFAIIAAIANGRTLIHDWVFENRAIYLSELDRVGVKVQLLDAHRVFITGPTHFRPASMMTPPALRPAMVLLLAMLAAPGRSILRNVYMINRGYADIVRRLNSLGADVKKVVGI